MIDATHPRRTLISVFALTLACSMPAMVTAAERFALVIGNSNYVVGTPLRNPVNDATDLANALEALGFQVDLHKDLDRRELADAVSQFARKLPGNSIALFFFAGHGVQLNGGNFLIPIDAQPASPADVPYECFEINRVLRNLEQGNSRLNVVVLDCCRNNPFARSWGHRSSESSGLAMMLPPEGSMVVFSTAPGKVAADGLNGARNSPFAASLIEIFGSRDPAGIELKQAFVRAARKVKSITDGKQVPWSGGADLTIEDYYLVPPSGGGTGSAMSNSSARPESSGGTEFLLDGSSEAPLEGRTVILRNVATAAGAIHIQADRKTWKLKNGQIARLRDPFYEYIEVFGVGSPGLGYFNGGEWEKVELNEELSAIEFDIVQINGNPRWHHTLVSPSQASWVSAQAPILNDKSTSSQISEKNIAESEKVAESKSGVKPKTSTENFLDGLKKPEEFTVPHSLGDYLEHYVPPEEFAVTIEVRGPHSKQTLWLQTGSAGGWSVASWMGDSPTQDWELGAPDSIYPKKSTEPERKRTFKAQKLCYLRKSLSASEFEARIERTGEWVELHPQKNGQVYEFTCKNGIWHHKLKGSKVSPADLLESKEASEGVEESIHEAFN